MIELVAPAKVTLSLRIVGLRDDGHHLIDAEMVTVDLVDRIRIEPSERVEVELVGPHAPDPHTLGDDLVARALRLAGRTARVQVHKAIPAGAGLEGGSADAAAVLRWAGWADVSGAAELGADVPFCLVGGRARVRGIGEEVVALPFDARVVTLLTPPIHCSTPAVYRRWDELGGPQDASGNDLTPAALDLAPDLARWRDVLGGETGSAPRLAGSGSTWFVDGAHPGPGRRVTRTVPAGWTGTE